MKILASGDHHFDEHSRFDQCIRVHVDMVRVARRETVDLFLSAGDIYERASTPKEREAVADWLFHMAEVCPVVIVRGNHDRDRDLKILARLETRHPIHVLETACVLEVAGALIAALPWPNPAALKASGMPPKEALCAVLRGLGDQMDGARVPRILLSHCMVDGSVVSNGQPLLGQPINVGLDDLALARADLGILGHIHKAQRWDINGNPHCYTGSPFRTEFGQTEEKTMLLAEFDGNKLVKLEEIPTAATPMVHLVGEWDESERALYADIDENQVTGAEVRLRYEVPLDRRIEAREMALRYKEEILQCGAVSVKVEEVPVVVKRARAPEVARSRSIVDKLAEHWKAVEFDPGTRREALLEKGREVEEFVGTTSSAPTSLQLHQYRCKDIGPHSGFSFDLDEYPQGSIIAFTGPNGAGKTTLLECSIGGTCHRKMPTQGTLVGRATSRESKQESVVTSGGRTFTIRHTMDAVSGKSEALVLNERDEPEYPGTSVKSFDKWSARFLPDPSVLYATQVSTQPAKRSRARFIDLDSAERISVLLKAMGVERIEAMATEARKRRDVAQVEFEKATARLADEVERTGDAVLLRYQLEKAKMLLAESSELVAITQKSLEETRKKNQESALEETRRAAKREEKARIEKDLDALKLKVLELKHKKGNLEQVLMGEEADAALAETLPTLEKERTQRDERDRDEKRLAALRKEAEESSTEITFLEQRIAEGEKLLEQGDEIRQAKADCDAIVSRIKVLQEEKDVASRRISDVQRALSDESADGKRRGEIAVERARHDAVLKQEDAVISAVDRLPEVLGEYGSAESDLELLQSVLDELQSSHVAGAEDRISSLRHGLANVTLTPAAAERIAHDALDEDDKVVELSQTLPAETESAKQKVRAAQARLEKARSEKDEVSRLASKRAEVVAARVQVDVMAKELSEILLRRDALRQDLATLRAELNELETAIAENRLELEKLQPTADRLSGLETAEALLRERRRALEAETKHLAAVLEEIAEVKVPAAESDFDGLDDRITAAEKAKTRMADRTVAKARLEDLLPQLASVESEVATETEKLAAFGDLSPVELVSTTDDERALEVLKKEETKARDGVTEASLRLKTAEERSAHIAVIRQEKEQLSADVADWTRLSLDFGRAGIQSAEVDSAGPELTQLANELLEECHGPRFRMSFDTSKLSADGKKNIDEFRIVVIDSENGREDEATNFSGGERVLLGECVENALLMLACLKNDVVGSTIVRDESGAALDPANARSYLKMLRLVVKKVRASHLLIVTHSTELQEQCDAVIEVATNRSSEDAAQTCTENAAE